MRLVGVLFQRAAACINQRVQLLRRLGHEIHGQRVPLRAILHLAERVDRVVKDILRAAQVAVCVRDGHAEIGIGCRCGLVAVPRLLHLIGGLFETVPDAVGRDADHLGGIIELLKTLH